MYKMAAKAFQITRFLPGIFLLFLFLFQAPVAQCETEHEQVHKEKFNPGKLIMHHIKDAHDWHIITWRGHPVSVPLPIIIYSEDRGFSVFMSSRFEHGHADYDGYRLDHEKIIAVDAEGNKDEAATALIWDFSITKNVVGLFEAVFIILLIFLLVAKAYKTRVGEAPKGLQLLMEPIIIFVRDDIAKMAIGPKYERFLPYLLTIFFFIWINNMLGLIPIFPGGANVTGNVAIPLVMALFTFVITTVVGNRNYWQHIFWMPGIPTAVKPLLLVIELMGVFVKPAVLVVRLFANIMAGHIVILVFISLIFIFGEKSMIAGYGVSVASVAFSIFLNFLEILVGAIQAYVFTLLSAIYFGLATQEAH